MKNNIVEETNFIMKKYHIKANKSLGQNFLISQEVIDTIVNKSEITESDLVIEIGPGLGTLTKYLLEKAGKVICIELDKRMIDILEDRFKLYDNFEIINKDVLKVELNQLIKEQKENSNIENVKIVANLPYYITTPIIMKLLEEKLDLESITVMIQKEVADRLIAVPGSENTGAITYSVYYYAEGESVLEVPNYSFIPEPEVTSEVIKLKIRKQPIVNVEDAKKMFKIIKNAFTQRRKTLLNGLTNTKIFKNKEEGVKILNEVRISRKYKSRKTYIRRFCKYFQINIKYQYLF